MARVLFESLLVVFPVLAAAQSITDTIILCMPGHCVQGYSNVTLGGTLSSSSVSPYPIHLLPGQYTSSTNPELLHNALTSSSKLQSSAGLNNTLSLPLNFELQPGLVTFSGQLYAGQAAFTSLSGTDNNSSTTSLNAHSITLSSDVIAIVSVASSSNHIILWDSIPDTQHLPSPLNTAQFSLSNLLSTTCAPSCSSGGVCSPQGLCTCKSGFTGQACEACASGFFGPSCQKCPDSCAQCDEGISGTGRCLKSIGGGNKCDCLNGVCNSDGSCQCNAGFTKADNGTQCAKCATGFFLTTTGDCKACEVGCTQCSDGTGACLSCKSGFSQDKNNRKNCNPEPQITSTGTTCPELAFSNGTSCQPCASPCQSCSGGTSNDCTACVQGQYMLNGVCVKANDDGVCEGTSLIADNLKSTCDACGSKCITCRIPNFNIASLASQAQCTSCIPGTFLSDGTCADACPSGTFVSSQDNMSCLPCDSSCSTCLGSATSCLTCSNSNQLAFNGTCFSASSCPKNTFASPSASSCLYCHPDCTSCSGSSFNQCLSCPLSRPVLSNGRCMPMCSRDQFWDPNANSCQSCHSSCGSCSGPGSSSCLSCSNANEFVLRTGSCVNSSQVCGGDANATTVINPFGVCFSELITVPSETSGLPPMPTVTGIDKPTTVVQSRRLEWWQILLMALGCAFIFIIVIWCCRRRYRKRKAEERRRVQAYAFANTTKRSWWRGGDEEDKNYTAQPYHSDPDFIPTNSLSKDKNNWKWRLIPFGEKFFGHSKSMRVHPMEMDRTARNGNTTALLSDPLSYSRFHEASAIDGYDYTPDRDRDSRVPNLRESLRPLHSHNEHPLDVPIDVDGLSSDHFHGDTSAVLHADHQRDTPSHRRSLIQGPTQSHQKLGLEKEEEQDMVQLISSYRYTVTPKTPPAAKAVHFHHDSESGASTPSNGSRNDSSAPLLPRLYYEYRDEDQSYRDRSASRHHPVHHNLTKNHQHPQSSISTDSMYSSLTGYNRRMPDARQPVRDPVPPVPELKSRFSMSSDGHHQAKRSKKFNKKILGSAGGLSWKKLLP